jgi:Glycosyltransferase
MKILLLARQIVDDNETFVTAGWIQSLILAMQEDTDWQIGFVCLTEGESSFSEEGNLSIYKVNLRRSRNPFYRVWQNLRGKVDNNKWATDYLKVVEEYQPDIVHVFGTESFIVDILPQIRQKVVIHIQGFAFFCSNVFGMSQPTLFRYSFRLIDYLKGHTQLQVDRVFKNMATRELAAFRHIEYCMGRTNWDKKIIKDINSNIRYFHVEEILRPQFYDAKPWKYNKSDTLRLISVLSPSLYKGFDLILKTAEILKEQSINFRWEVCGTSEDDNVVYFFENQLGLCHKELNISCVGKVAVGDLIDKMRNSDIFIHTSYIDNSPNSVCEAQMLGIPVIATNVGGVPSLIENDETGILVPINDPYSLVSKILDLYEDEIRTNRISEESRKVAFTRHDRATVMKRLSEVYEEVLGG